MTTSKYPVPQSLLEVFSAKNAVVTLDVNFLRGNQASMIRRLFWYNDMWHVQAKFRRWIDVYHGNSLDDAVQVLMTGSKSIEEQPATTEGNSDESAPAS